MGRRVDTEKNKNVFRGIPGGWTMRKTPKVRIHESVLLDILEPLKPYAISEGAKKPNPELKLVEKKKL